MKEKIAKISILANLVLATGKIIVGLFSHSGAILAGGIDSLSDIFSSFISYIGIKMSDKPADKEHPYGHYKFEVFGGVIVAIIIAVTGVGIVFNAFGDFFNPTNITISHLAIEVMVFSAIVNEIMARLKTYYGKKENSIGLLSDGAHSKIDVYTSIAILASLFLTKYWIYADAVIALLMGIYIIREAFLIGREALGSLLDVSAGEEIDNEIKSIVKKNNIELNSLKTQKKGSAITANLEIKLSSVLHIEEATKISNSLREKLTEEVNNLEYIAIQIISHKMQTNFFKPEFGRGFSWQKGGRFQDKIKDATGKGPDGYCICEECGFKRPHHRGTPCSNLDCPKCKIALKRE
ncbi:cation transporter [bacterium]|nr:MAG: cation transporter [bacterium]